MTKKTSQPVIGANTLGDDEPMIEDAPVEATNELSAEDAALFDFPSATAVGYTDTPTLAERLAANPYDPDSVARVWYRPDGRVTPQSEVPDPATLGPEGMPPATQDDAPFSTDDIPAGWGRHPTQAEVDYLNAKFPVEGYVPPPPDYSGTFTAFSQTSPTVASADLEDVDALDPGFRVTLMALSGTTEGMAAIDGKMVDVLAVGEGVTLGIDLSEVDTMGLAADYIWEAPV